jgi:hypothetical protein
MYVQEGYQISVRTPWDTRHSRRYIPVCKCTYIYIYILFDIIYDGQKLTHLEFCNNGLGATGARILAAPLNALKGLQYLNLSSNQ